MISAHNGPRSYHRASRIRFHLGGSLATVSFPETEDLPRPQVGGGLRGKIRGFSPASRRRLLRRIAAVNKFASDRPPAFLTITYPNEYPEDPTVYRSHARAFLKRLRRKYGDRPVIWRLEFQRRGAPHFHMLIWDLEVTEDMEDWVRETWYDVVGSGDTKHQRHGTDLRQVDSWKGVAVYLSKYIAKVADENGEVHEPIGRWWGVESGALLVTEPVDMVTSVRAGLKARRIMQKYAGLRRPGQQEFRSATVFLDDDPALRLARYLGARFEALPPVQPYYPPPQAPGGMSFVSPYLSHVRDTTRQAFSEQLSLITS